MNLNDFATEIAHVPYSGGIGDENAFCTPKIERNCLGIVNQKEFDPVRRVITEAQLARKKPLFDVFVLKCFLAACGITLMLNEMNDAIEVRGVPQEYSGDNVLNWLTTLVVNDLAHYDFKRLSEQSAHAMLQVVAAENRYHPVLKLLNKKLHDGVDRLGELYEIMGIGTNKLYCTFVHKWLLQTAMILHNTGNLHNEYVLVLQGSQGCGKTTLAEKISIRPEFFKGGVTIDMGNKDTQLLATRHWISELGEFDATSKKDQSALKSFITQSVDSIRVPYGRAEKHRPRRTAFIATVNPEQFLVDRTGNRRFVVIKINQIDHVALRGKSEDWYLQLWRQILSEYKENPLGYLLSTEEETSNNQENIEFESKLYGEDELLSRYDPESDIKYWEFQLPAEIADSINCDYAGLNLRAEGIGRIRRKWERTYGIKFEQQRRRDGRSSARTYYKFPKYQKPEEIHEIPQAKVHENNDIF